MSSLSLEELGQALPFISYSSLAQPAAVLAQGHWSRRGHWSLRPPRRWRPPAEVLLPEAREHSGTRMHRERECVRCSVPPLPRLAAAQPLLQAACYRNGGSVRGCKATESLPASRPAAAASLRGANYVRAGRKTRGGSPRFPAILPPDKPLIPLTFTFTFGIKCDEKGPIRHI